MIQRQVFQSTVLGKEACLTLVPLTYSEAFLVPENGFGPLA